MGEMAKAFHPLEANYTTAAFAEEEDIGLVVGDARLSRAVAQKKKDGGGKLMFAICDVEEDQEVDQEEYERRMAEMEAIVKEVERVQAKAEKIEKAAKGSDTWTQDVRSFYGFREGEETTEQALNRKRKGLALRYHWDKVQPQLDLSLLGPEKKEAVRSLLGKIIQPLHEMVTAYLFPRDHFCPEPKNLKGEVIKRNEEAVLRITCDFPGRKSRRWVRCGESRENNHSGRLWL